ncbi:hypothetical protein SODALDRAFT_329155 [Sodiomyces alkalinus F11]|uniref:Uncharacterized protein n=1 Tax=Sodiomyces alkalinus (strain CBS 110278 / VKM F-3762 / F11) TaxID=1314773 RepID=A0A3N2PKC0_SODAK|nr:hypothetical protein SODALDRAFT_329155 [Sodiomyces alkalinus F11]ROT34955.1 hypothetical protein SODALDRAFT_329155 [Sodiomyces alkalinus F11]
MYPYLTRFPLLQFLPFSHLLLWLHYTTLGSTMEVFHHSSMHIGLAVDRRSNIVIWPLYGLSSVVTRWIGFLSLFFFSFFFPFLPVFSN